MTTLKDRIPRVLLLLDRSGSMASCREHALAAVNGYLAEAKDDPALVGGRISVLTFDSTAIVAVRQDVAIATCPAIEPAEFVPGGATPLLDSVAHAVGVLDRQQSRPDDPRILIVLTDGYENASVEHTRASVAAMLEARQTAGWLVLYLGANQDSWGEASKLGIARATVADIAFSNHEELALSMFGISNRYFNGGPRGFTADERASLKRLAST